MDKTILLSKPYFEQSQLTFDLSTSRTLCGDGPFSREAEAKIAEKTGSKFVMVTGSCTHALELSIMALGIQSGDEVIVPSFTFVSTANAVVRSGGVPVFVDIDESTLNISPDALQKALTPRTKACIVMHYGGIACEMEKIQEIATASRIAIIEDAAHSIDAFYKGRHLGTMGTTGCFSFHETKNITCGEGGAFLTSDPEIAERAQIIRHKGTDRIRFLNGKVDKYTWCGQGSNLLLAELPAELLCKQLSSLDFITAKRRSLFKLYQDYLAPLAESGLIRLPTIPEGCHHNAHIFYAILPTEQQRITCEERLRRRKIQAFFHYQPLHLSPYILSLNRPAQSLPITESISKRLIRLPLHPALESDDIKFVSECFTEIVLDIQ